MEETNMYNPLFKVYKLNDMGRVKAQDLGLLFQDFYNEVHTLCFGNVNSTLPNWEGREWSIVKTKLEEASFYAKKCLAMQPGHSE